MVFSYHIHQLIVTTYAERTLRKTHLFYTRHHLGLDLWDSENPWRLWCFGRLWRFGRLSFLVTLVVLFWSLEL